MKSVKLKRQDCVHTLSVQHMLPDQPVYFPPALKFTHLIYFEQNKVTNFEPEGVVPEVLRLNCIYVFITSIGVRGGGEGG